MPFKVCKIEVSRLQGCVFGWINLADGLVKH